MSYVQSIIDEQDRKNLDLLAERDALRTQLELCQGIAEDRKTTVGDLCNRVDSLIESRKEIQAERDTLRAALANLLIDIDREDSNTEGQLLAHLVDAGCIECTAGTTTEVHPRICAYHHAKRITLNSALKEGGAA